MTNETTVQTNFDGDWILVTRREDGSIRSMEVAFESFRVIIDGFGCTASCSGSDADGIDIAFDLDAAEAERIAVRAAEEILFRAVDADAIDSDAVSFWIDS